MKGAIGAADLQKRLDAIRVDFANMNESVHRACLSVAEVSAELRRIDQHRRNDSDFDPNASIERLTEDLNEFHVFVQRMKLQFPEARIGYSLTVGGILNAYREGDVLFEEAVALLEVKRPPAST